MGESKKGKTANKGEKEDNSLLVGLTVTSIAAAAVIGYSAGQIKMANIAYDQISMLISSSPKVEDTSVESTMALSEEAYSNLVEACKSIHSPDADATE
jgi:hypothetical protein